MELYFKVLPNELLIKILLELPRIDILKVYPLVCKHCLKNISLENILTQRKLQFPRSHAVKFHDDVFYDMSKPPMPIMDKKNVDLVKGDYAFHADGWDISLFLFDGIDIIEIYTTNPDGYTMYSFPVEYAVLENDIPLYYWYDKNDIWSLFFVMFNQYNFVDQTILNLTFENDIITTHFEYERATYCLVFKENKEKVINVLTKNKYNIYTLRNGEEFKHNTLYYKDIESDTRIYPDYDHQ